MGSSEKDDVHLGPPKDLDVSKDSATEEAKDTELEEGGSAKGSTLDQGSEPGQAKDSGRGSSDTGAGGPIGGEGNGHIEGDDVGMGSAGKGQEQGEGVDTREESSTKESQNTAIKEGVGGGPAFAEEKGESGLVRLASADKNEGAPVVPEGDGGIQDEDVEMGMGEKDVAHLGQPGGLDAWKERGTEKSESQVARPDDNGESESLRARGQGAEPGLGSHLDNFEAGSSEQNSTERQLFDGFYDVYPDTGNMSDLFWDGLDGNSFDQNMDLGGNPLDVGLHPGEGSQSTDVVPPQGASGLTDMDRNRSTSDMSSLFTPRPRDEEEISSEKSALGARDDNMDVDEDRNEGEQAPSGSDSSGVG
ncbi:hypothetical protein EV361DRAFT_874990, partial [Lentinula raphanica]